jgi:hypothetical protein
MTHPVQSQIDLEILLLKQTSEVASLLNAPLSPERSDTIAQIWQIIARSYGSYQKGHANIHPSKMDRSGPPEPTELIDARVDFMRFGAYRASLWDKVATLLERQTEPVQKKLRDTHNIRAVTRQDDLISHLAHTSAEDVASTKERAEAIGPDWQIVDSEIEKELGFWLPIVQASRANGFCLPR